MTSITDLEPAAPDAPVGLPRIAGYPMPGPADLPTSRADWPLSAARAVLLVHDMQNHFLDAYDRDSEPVPALLAALRQVLAAARASGVPVVFTCQPGDQAPAERALLTDLWGPGLTRGRPAELVADLQPLPGENVLTKWRYSAFQRTELRQLLADTGRDQLLVTGVYAHIGCLLTAAEAFMSDVQPFLVADAVADFSAADHRMALDYAARRCARVVSTGTVLRELVAPAWTPERLRLRIAELVQENPDSIDDDDDLLDLGLDSIRLMGLAEEFRSTGCGVPFARLAERPTVRAWSRLLDGTSA